MDERPNSGLAELVPLKKAKSTFLGGRDELCEP